MDKLTLQKLEKTLWDAADILRGELNAAQYMDYIFGLLFLKRMNDQFEIEQNGDFDYRITFYLNGVERTCIRFWLGNMMGFGNESIFISYDRYNFSNNSFNEMITGEVKNNELKLKMTMNVFGFNGDTVEDSAKQLWKNICGYLTV